MRIRKMVITDYDMVYDLWLSCTGMGLNTMDDSREGIERFLRRNPDTCYVAEEDSGELVGVILSGHDGRRGFIYHTAVLSAARGRGIGKQLVEHALDSLREQGIIKVALVVFERNAAGNAFWEKMGFTAREDLVYRNRAFTEITRIDT